MATKRMVRADESILPHEAGHAVVEGYGVTAHVTHQNDGVLR